MSRRARRSLLSAAVGLIAWYLAVLLLWAVQPLSDAVPIGIDWSPTVLDPPKAAKQVSQTVQCNNLFAGSARNSSPLPTLNPQPPKKPELTYSRGACSAVQRDARIVFALNTMFVMVAIAGLVVISRRLGRPPPGPAAQLRSTVSLAGR